MTMHMWNFLNRISYQICRKIIFYTAQLQSFWAFFFFFCKIVKLSLEICEVLKICIELILLLFFTNKKLVNEKIWDFSQTLQILYQNSEKFVFLLFFFEQKHVRMLKLSKTSSNNDQSLTIFFKIHWLIYLATKIDTSFILMKKRIFNSKFCVLWYKKEHSLRFLDSAAQNSRNFFKKL